MKPFFLKVLPFLGVALATTPAWASGWTTGFEYDGKNVVGSFDNGMHVTPSVTQPWGNNGRGTGQSAASTAAFWPSAKQDGSCSGHYILVLRLPVGEKLPPTVGVRFNQGAFGSGSKQHGTTAKYISEGVELSGTPGSVALTTKVTMPGGTSYSDTDHPPTYDNSTNRDNYTSGDWVPPALVTISTSNATVESGFYVVRYPLPPVEAKFTVTVGDFPYVSDRPRDYGSIKHSSDSAQASVSVSASAGIDNRSLQLTRGVAPKMWNDPTLNKDHDEWCEVDSSGSWTTHGHTTYSYHWIAVSSDNTNFQNIQANLGGTWTWKTDPQGTGDIPDVSWSWSPVGSDPGDTYLSSRQKMRPGTPNRVSDGWVGKPTSTDTHTVTYSATDNGNGAKATAKYTFTLHDAWEEDSTTGPKAITKNPQPITAPIIHPKSATKPQEYTFTVTQTKKLALKSGFSTELGKSVAELLKVVPKFSLDVTYEDSFAEAEGLKWTLKPGEQTWVDIVENYDRYPVKGFSWNPNGFVGSSDFDVDVIPSNRKHYAYELHLPPIQTEAVGNTGGGTTP